MCRVFSMKLKKTAYVQIVGAKFVRTPILRVVRRLFLEVLFRRASITLFPVLFRAGPMLATR